eukprot:2917845-Rhodomonas_salina.2
MGRRCRRCRCRLRSRTRRCRWPRSHRRWKRIRWWRAHSDNCTWSRRMSSGSSAGPGTMP